MRAGFRGIDSSNAGSGCREDLVGIGLRNVLANNNVKRGDIDIQTGFTPPVKSASNYLPYSRRAPIATQVSQSVMSSLHHLRVSEHPGGAEGTYLDCLMLETPLSEYEQTLEVWQALEKHVPDTVKFLGIRNPSLPILQGLYKDAKIKPSVVYQGFHPKYLYDVPGRRWCKQNGITIQYSPPGPKTMSRLTRSTPVQTMSKSLDVTPQSVMFACILGLEDTTISTGTVEDIERTFSESEKIQDWILANDGEWQNILKHFKDIIGDNETEPVNVQHMATGVKPAAAMKTPGT